MNAIKFKTPKTLDEQLDYLYQVKRVRFNIIQRDVAKQILQQYGYINVITPYKHRFAMKDNNGIQRDKCGNHIYDHDIEFSEYYEAFQSERIQYPTIYTNLMNFEEKFNSIVSYEMIHYYRLIDNTTFNLFILNLLTNCNTLESNETYNGETCEHMRNSISLFKKSPNKYGSIYIAFDRANLSQLIAIFRCCDPELRSSIFKILMNHSVTFGYNTLTSFDELLIRIPSIRNRISHFNSLEILIM